MALSLANLSINQATLRQQCSLDQAITEISEAGIGGIGIWRDKLHETGVSQARRLIESAGLKVSGLCRGGMFTGEDPALADTLSASAVFEDNKRAVDEAAEVEAQCLVLVVGGLGPKSKALDVARTAVADGLQKILEYARNAGVVLAIEPLHPLYNADRSVVSTLGQALDLCDILGEGIGVAVDVYHTWWDPDLEQQIKRAGHDRLLAFHICDWLYTQRDPLLDRGMMGDGVIDLEKISCWVQDAGYSGQYEVEIFSKFDWWNRPAKDVLEMCASRYRECCPH